MPDKKKLTVTRLRKMKQEHTPIVMLTAYDAPTARLADLCGVDMLLVGDSVGMAVLGYDNTLAVTLEQSLHHCAAVKRGAPDSFIVGDMPFMTYQISPEQALANAARYIQEAHCDAIKLEGNREIAPTVHRLTAAGVPVMGHIGLRPQQCLVEGGYKIAGKTESAAEALFNDARAMQEAGAFAIVLECVPAKLAKEISESLDIPTIGIGAGAGCDGQVQVVNDILGLFTDFIPKHAKRSANLSAEMQRAFTEYVDDVRNRRFPTDANSF